MSARVITLTTDFGERGGHRLSAEMTSVGSSPPDPQARMGAVPPVPAGDATLITHYRR